MTKRILMPTLAIICTFICIMIASYYAYLKPSKAEPDQKQIAEIIAKGDSAIMTEYLNGFEPIKARAVMTAQKGEIFGRSFGYSCISGNPKLLPIAIKVLEKGMSTDSLIQFIYYNQTAYVTLQQQIFELLSSTTKEQMENFMLQQAERRSTWSLTWLWFLNKHSLEKVLSNAPSVDRYLLAKRLLIPKQDTSMLEQVLRSFKPGEKRFNGDSYTYKEFLIRYNNNYCKLIKSFKDLGIPKSEYENYMFRLLEKYPQNDI